VLNLSQRRRTLRQQVKMQLMLLQVRRPFLPDRRPPPNPPAVAYRGRGGGVVEVVEEGVRMRVR
jgi:hypothetical protein